MNSYRLYLNPLKYHAIHAPRRCRKGHESGELCSCIDFVGIWTLSSHVTQRIAIGSELLCSFTIQGLHQQTMLPLYFDRFDNTPILFKLISLFYRVVFQITLQISGFLDDENGGCFVGYSKIDTGSYIIASFKELCIQ